MDINDEERPVLSLSEGRELLKNTALANITDEELAEVLDSIREFCEICFDHYFNRVEKEPSQNNNKAKQGKQHE